jgi:SagB-type dehydrogenase family enzyme
MKKPTVIALIISLTILTFVIFFLTYMPEEKEPIQIIDGDIIELPTPALTGVMSVEQAIKKRRSVRSYTDEPLNLNEISQLMWAVQGITEPNRKLRAVPSAGATYPLEVFIAIGENGVIGLNSGLYRYNPYAHSLIKELEGDLRFDLAGAALGQEFIYDAPINIIITAIYERTTARYGDRGIRYVHLEAGHAGQNLHLQGVALNLGMVMVGAFRDDEVRNILHLTEDYSILYIIPVGHPHT